MITYTVFDPDDGTGVSYRWYGSDDTTVYVHSSGAEVDAFELPEGTAATIPALAEAVAAHHETHRTYRDDHSEPPVELGLDLGLDPEQG